MTELLLNMAVLFLDASFWLVIGLLIGGIFKTLIPTDLLHRHLSSGGFGAIIKAALLGAPLPLCSCGVIPAAMGLRQAGASKPATTSFLVSTPETGIDSVFITYAMMGPFMAITRPIVAIVSAITTGTLVNAFDRQQALVSNDSDQQESTCCSKNHDSSVAHDLAHDGQKHGDCCDVDTNSQGTQAKRWRHNIWQGIVYAFTDLFDNIVVWLVIGILFAAVVQTFVSSDLLISYGAGITGMLLMLVVGIPMYVCATASTPLAAGFLLAGISPGAVLVFLLAGPATNMATLGIINKHMGHKTMWLYLLGIMSVALISGFVVNALVAKWNIDIRQFVHASHSHVPLWLQISTLILLLAVSLRRFMPLRR